MNTLLHFNIIFSSPVRDVDTSIQGTLHGSKDSVPCGSPSQTHVQEGPEGACTITHVLHIVVLACNLRLTFILVCQIQFSQNLGKR